MSKPSNPESVRVKVNRPDPLAFRGAAFALTETAFVLLGPGAGEAALCRGTAAGASSPPNLIGSRSRFGAGKSCAPEFGEKSRPWRWRRGRGRG